MYTSANASMFMEQRPWQPVKSTAGTVIRHGSPGGMSLGFAPLQGSATDAQLAILDENPPFTGPALPLLPGSVDIESPTLYDPDAPFWTFAPSTEAPVPPSESHCQLPEAAPVGLNLTPNGTAEPGFRLARLHGLVHCTAIGKSPVETVYMGPFACAAAIDDTL